MRAVEAHVVRALPLGAKLVCADNSGALELQIIAVKGYKGVRGRNPRAGVADLVVVSVKKGKPELVKKVMPAVIVRQRKEYRRQSGTRICFEDNAAVLVDEKGDLKATEIRGPVALEVVQRFPKLAGFASMIV